MASRLHSYTIRRTLKMVGAVLMMIAAAFALSWLLIRAFTIRNIIVDAPLMTLELDKNRFGKNLLFLPTEKLRTDLLSNYPLLSDVRFEKKYPGTLIVHLVRRNVFAILVSEGNVYAIDEYGLVLGGVGQNPGYPELIFSSGGLAIGSIAPHKAVIQSLGFLRALGKALPISRMMEKDSSSIQAVSGNTNIFLPQSGDMSVKADTLQTIVEGFRIKGTLPTVIDLRFEKPIITN